jgi:hypothetical protein
LVASLIGMALMAGAADAQTAAPVARPLKKATPSDLVMITNSRAVELTELDATPDGGYLPKKIASNIAAGKKAAVHVATDKGCVFDLRGAYADGSSTELTGVDLCKDKNVNLVD